MRLTSLDVILLGHRKVDPPMQRTYALIRVEGEGGLVGYGEASSNYGHSYPTVIKTVVEDVVARNLIGKDALDIRRRTADMHVLLDGYLGWEGISSQVIGGIEIALWDLLGKHAGLPICRLLGAAPTTLPVYGTGTTMFEATPEWYGEYYDACLARGFKAVKVRLDVGIPEAVERVAAVRKHVGPDVRIMVDAYWGYSTDDALTLARKLEPFDVYFFEEPSPQYQAVGMKRLGNLSPVKIAVGERVYSPHQYQAIAADGAAQVFEPDPCLCGGIVACMEIATIARLHDIVVVPHTGSPTPVGLAAGLHWAAAAGCPLFEYDIDPSLPVRDELMPEPIFDLAHIVDGRIAVPDGPGLGVTIDESAFARFPYVAGETYAEVFPEHEAGGFRRT
jgi:L-alanine-DL-glutamate epimerase-like enolase superfamily enzyme